MKKSTYLRKAIRAIEQRLDAIVGPYDERADDLCDQLIGARDLLAAITEDPSKDYRLDDYLIDWDLIGRD